MKTKPTNKNNKKPKKIETNKNDNKNYTKPNEMQPKPNIYCKKP